MNWTTTVVSVNPDRVYNSFLTDYYRSLYGTILTIATAIVLLYFNATFIWYLTYDSGIPTARVIWSTALYVFLH